MSNTADPYDTLLAEAAGRPFAAIAGWPVGHSRSPALHGFWLKQHRIDAHYGRLPVEPKRAALEKLVSFLKSTPNARGCLEDMRALGFAGYLVKPVRQSSLVTRLLLCCSDRRAESPQAAAGAQASGCLGPHAAPVMQSADADEPPHFQHRTAGLGARLSGFRSARDSRALHGRPSRLRTKRRACCCEDFGGTRVAHSPGRGQSHQHDADPRAAAPPRP